MTGVQTCALPISAPPVPAPKEQQVLYDARCSNCGKDTKVVFPPDGKRPVYCKACRKKLARKRGEIDVQVTQSQKNQPAELGKVRPQQEDEQKKEKDAHGLQAVLREALQKARGNSSSLKEEGEAKKGVLKPGETIYFKK